MKFLIAAAALLAIVKLTRRPQQASGGTGGGATGGPTQPYDPGLGSPVLASYTPPVRGIDPSAGLV